MKLVVQGIEAIELTDPQGLCNPLSPQLPAMVPGMPPAGYPFQPQPKIPAPRPGIPGDYGDPTIRPIPGTGDIVPEHRPSIYTTHLGDPTKWVVGGEAIQRAGQQVDPDKWEKNWQSKLTGGDPDNGERSTH